MKQAKFFPEWMQWIRDRKRAYQLTFNAADAANRQVLSDLAKFCRAHETCVVPGDRDLSLILEGRREVWLRIEQQLNLPPETLYMLAGAPQPKGQS